MINYNRSMSDARSCASPSTATMSPLSFLHPSRVSMALDPRLTAETVRKLQNCGRLHERLVTQLQPILTQQDLWPIPASAEFLVPPGDPQGAARLAGAIWHSASLRLIVTGKAAAELVAAIGENAFTFGLRHAAAAIAPAQTHRPSDLAEAIEHDGLACLGAWLSAEPKARRDAVLLRLSLEDAKQTCGFGPKHQSACQAVMAAVMAEGDVR
jgi:hypothetical protein